MNDESRTALAVLPDEAATLLALHPFAHIDAERIYHPLTGVALTPGAPGFAEISRLASGLSMVDDLSPEVRARLLAERWLLAEGEDPGQEFRLRIVSLEAHTVCNQSCYFCPVSIAPRDDYFMPTELYERIVRELAGFRDTIEAVFMINYNEPTVDKRFVEQVRTIRAAGLPPAVLTNGSGLTPDRVDALVEMGGLRFLSINLSTLDRERYKSERGGDQLPLVLKNLAYAKERPVAEKMDVIVLGTGDENHRRDFAEIGELFAGSRFEVKSFEVMDRAGYLQIGLGVPRDGKRLRGCDNLGSRPIEHLHITPRAQVVLCCEDYDEFHVVGDLAESSVLDVLRGPELSKMRRMIYGLDDAPANFICNKCTFARRA